MAQPILQTRALTKVFGALTACDAIDLSIFPGRIHAIAGENGAGKSTLMKMLYGVYTPTAGQLLADGRETRDWNPARARAAGVGMVFQDFRLIPAFSVLENIFLADSTSGRLLNKKRLRQDIRALSQRYDLEVDPDAEVWKLDLGQRQHVEIIKVLSGKNARVLIFDEPTSVLAPHEIDAFLEMLRQLRADDYAILLITHKIREIMAVADEVSVLRHGRLVSHFARDEGLDEKRIVASMLGEDTGLAIDYPRYIEAAGGEPEKEALVEVRDLAVKDDHDRRILQNARFDIRKGEILGVAGISGNGQKELAEALFGFRPVEAGTLTIAGQSATKASIEERIGLGLRIVTEDPLRDNVVRSFTILENMALAGIPLARRGIDIDWPAMLKAFEGYEVVQTMKVPAPNRYAATLSGGNLQRMSFARAVVSAPSLLIASYPSRGLDVATVSAVHQILLKLREAGASVLLISEDLSELFALSDRLIVLAQGTVYGAYDPTACTPNEIGNVMLKGDEAV